MIIISLSFFSGLSPSPVIKPVAAPAAHSILKNGSLPVPSYNPSYSVQSPYSTINVSFFQESIFKGKF